MRVYGASLQRWLAPAAGLGPVLRFVLGLVLGLGLPAGSARAGDPASLIVVFDGSGSMWGSIDGAKASKLVLAREAVRRGLGKINPSTRVGVAAFGHRRGDCGDVEVLRAPEPLDVQRVLEPLDRLNPKGRGPLTLALREAAKSLPAAGKKSLVLIHDDADNCQQDLCTVAGELRAANIAVHVVGLALKAEDTAKMLCLPQITGGRLFAAMTAADVAPTIEQALQLADGAAAEQTALASPVAPAAPVAADAPPGLYLRALLAPNGAPIGWPLKWTVSVEGHPDQILFSGRGSNPTISTGPGRYLIEAGDGAVSASRTVEVQDKGPTLAELVLNAGLLRISARMGKAGGPLDDAIVSIAEAGQADAPPRHAALGALVGAYKGGDVMALLPAGRLVVRVEDGLVHAERSIVVPQGSQGHLDVVLDAARLQVFCVGRDGSGGLEAPVFSVDEDDPDAPKGRREVARSGMRQADFVLPPGTYYVVARQGSVEARERLALGPGEVARRSLAVAVGRLALATKATGLEARSDPVAYRVERIDVPYSEPIITSRPTPVLALAPGRYRVEGRYGAVNARSTREVEIKPGQTQQLTLEPQAATVKLRLLTRAGGPRGGEVFWEIRDDAGKTVWTTAEPEPSATLQAGRYVVRAEVRESSYDRAVELRAGESRVVEVVAD
jgi:Ca-activated chloride channel homolog